MTTAIGVVMTEHIVAGRLEDQKLTGNLLRYPGDVAELDARELAGSRGERGRPGLRRRAAERGLDAGGLAGRHRRLGARRVLCLDS